MSKAAYSWYLRVSQRMRGAESDRGANLVEYLGMVILVAGIIVAIRLLNLDAQLSAALKGAVEKIL